MKTSYMKYQLFAGLLMVGLFAGSCSSSSSTTNLSSIAPSFYVTSVSSDASSRDEGAETDSYDVSLGEDRAETDKPEEDMAPDSAESEAASDFTEKSTTTLKTALGEFSPGSKARAECYGPPWTDNATGSSTVRPSGDLGMVFATVNGTSTRACAAGQAGFLMGQRAATAKMARRTVALMITAAQDAGLSKPANLNDFINVTMPAITGVTFSTARITHRGLNGAGFAIYKFEIVATTAAGKPISVTVHHSPQDATNATFEGVVEAVLPYVPTSGSGNARGFAMTYKRTSTSYQFVMEGAANRTTASANFFTGSRRINFSSPAAGEDLFKMLGNFNRSTKGGTIHYAWQAGSGDGAARAFAFKAASRNSGAQAVGYFGFTPGAIGTLADTIGGASIWATRMFCNWVNTFTAAPVSGLQKQTMTFTSGKFVPNVNNIDFGPTDSCNVGGSWTITGGPTFKNGSQGAVTHNLVSYTASDVDSVTVPSVTIP